MRILYLADIRFPLERANGIQTMETCAALARRGHAVTLLVRPDTAQPTRDPWRFYGLEPDGRLTIEQPAALGWGLPAPLRRVMYIGWARARAHRRAGFDLVLTRDLGVAARLLRVDRARRPPVVYESHGYAPAVSAALPQLLSNGTPPTTRKTRRLDARERCVWTRADAYVTITAALARDLTDRFGQRKWIATVPDGVHLASGRQFALPRRGPGRPAVAAYAGHLYPWKGVGVLIDALVELPDVRGLIIGGHPQEPDLGRLRDRAQAAGVADRVEFTGLLPPAHVHAQLLRADVLVLPNPSLTISAKYTSPLKLFEYMAAGRPIVASDLPAIREIIQDGRNGVLAEPGNAAALARAISGVLHDRTLAQRIARAAFDEAAFYTWDRRAERLERLFEVVVS